MLGSESMQIPQHPGVSSQYTPGVDKLEWVKLFFNRGG